MIERSHPKRSVGAQCRRLSISRSLFDCAAQDETAMNLDLMLLIDQPFLANPVLRRPADDLAPAEV